MSYKPRKVYEEALLEGVAERGEIRVVVELLGVVSERTVRKRRRQDPEFAASLDAAFRRYRESSSNEGVRRVRSRLARADLD